MTSGPQPLKYSAHSTSRWADLTCAAYFTQYQRTYIHIGNSADQYRDDGGSDGSGAILAMKCAMAATTTMAARRPLPAPAHAVVSYTTIWYGTTGKACMVCGMVMLSLLIYPRVVMIYQCGNDISAW